MGVMLYSSEDNDRKIVHDLANCMGDLKSKASVLSASVTGLMCSGNRDEVNKLKEMLDARSVSLCELETLL